MKKLFLALCVMLSGMAFAENENRAMYIYNTNGYIHSFPVAGIDSVMFEAPEPGINLAPHQLSIHKGDYAHLEAQAIGFDIYQCGGFGCVNLPVIWTIGNDSIIKITEKTPSSYAVAALDIVGLRVGSTTITAECNGYSRTMQVEVLPMRESYFVTEETLGNYMITSNPFSMLSFMSDIWSYWATSELTTDECVIPTREGGDWNDGGYWRDIHTHNSPAASENMYKYMSEGITKCNYTIDVFRYAKISDAEKEENILQMEALRCFYGYMMLDCFGAFPFEDSEYVPGQNGKMQSAQENWSKIVECLERIAPQLPKVTDANRLLYVGKATQGFAYALLARLYLNAESFGCVGGTNYYTDVVRCCDKVIQSGSYAIEDDYFTNFKIQNESSRENIFVLVKDGTTSNWLDGYSMTNKARLHLITLPYAMQEVWNMKEKPWNGACATQSFIKRFEYGRDVRGLCDTIQGSDACDGRGWLAGPIKKDGVIVKDNMYWGGDNDVILNTNISSLTYATRNDGARMIKYETDKTGTYNYMENDFVLFRYADILYMKAEAILRGRAGDLNQLLEDASFRKIRQRAGVDYYTSLTLDELLDERGREFYWECVRRRDLIRFGRYNDPGYIDYLENTDPANELSPLPASALATELYKDGTYIVLEGKYNDENLMSMANAINEISFEARDGFYEKYIYLRATDKFYIAQVTNGNRQVLGGTLEAASLLTDNDPVIGYKGSLKGATAMRVDQDGLYHISYDKSMNAIIVVPVEWGVSGGFNYWGWTGYGDEQASADGSEFEWTWNNVFVNPSATFAFKNNNVWKVYVGDGNELRISTCLYKDMKSYGNEFTIDQPGYYTIKLKYHLAGGELSNSYSYEVVLEKAYTIDGTSLQVSLIGSAIPGSDWANDTDLTYEGIKDGYYTYSVENLTLSAEGFKLRFDHAWINNLGFYDLTIVGDEANFTDDSGNIKVITQKTYKKISYQFTIENNTIKNRRLVFEL